MNSFYSSEELKDIGFRTIGEQVLISRNCCIYGASRISIGHNVRIDDFCVLSGNIIIGNYVHIAVGCAVFGGTSGIEFKDYTALSSRSAIYAESDDYTGEAMTNPTIPDEFRKVTGRKVVLEKYALVGTGCTILPNVTIGEGASVGAMSLINKSLSSWGMYAGIPCRKIRYRSRNIMNLEQKFVDTVARL